MKVEFDTKNWFKDKLLTAIVMVGVISLLNTCLLISILCNLHSSQSTLSSDVQPSMHGYRAVIKY